VYWTAPNSYALEPAGPVSNFGTIGLAKQQGCSKVYMLYALGGSPADAKSFIDNFTKTTAQYGMKSDSAVIAVGSSNMSSYVAKAAASGADCAFVNAYGTDFIALMKAALTSKMKILTVPGYITPAAIKSLGAAMENVHAVTATWPIADIDQHPGLTEFKEQIDKYSADPKAYDVNAMQTWSASRAITIAISQVQGDVTAVSVGVQLDKFHDFDPLVGPKVSFDKPSIDKPEYARIFAPYALQINWKNGVEHANGSFFNFFTTEPVT
jgi:ABC-type branched-subunit amino acid transport system substrate-binding protein